MRMRMTNVTQKIERIELVPDWFHSSKCECELLMRQNESLHTAISANANVLADWKSFQTQGRGTLAHTAEMKNYTGPLIEFVIRISHSHSDYAQVES